MATLLRSALLGKTEPRLFTPPLRDLDDPKITRGHEAIRFAETVLGLRLFPWQKWLLLHLLELNPDKTFRFRTAIVLVGRQNGKTTLLLVLFLWRLYVDGARLVIGTAQNLDIAEETWANAVDLAESVPDLAAEIAHVDKTNGKKSLRLSRGERYKVATASRRGGRSLSGDFIGLDELREHQTWESWAAVTKTTMARPKAQVLGLSNAGDRASIVLAFLRAKALAGITAEVDQSLGIFEWSAPDGCEIDDRDGWAQANPSLGYVDQGWPYSLTERAIESSMQTDPENVFRTEVLCQWVDDLVDPIIPWDVWAQHADPDAARPTAPCLALDVSPSRTMSCIAVAGDVDGRPLVEVTAEREDLLDHRPGTDWVVPRMMQLAQRHGTWTVYLTGTAAESLRPELEAEGFEVTALSGPTLAQACGVFYDAAVLPRGQGLIHSGQPSLDLALSLARRSETDHGWQWGRRKSAGDITPLVAATVALWAHTNATPGDPSAYFI